MTDLRRIMVDTLQRDGKLTRIDAESAAAQVINSLCTRWQGERVYIPGPQPDLDARAKVVAAAIQNGTSQRQVAKQLGVSQSTVSRTRRVGGFGSDEWNI